MSTPFLCGPCSEVGRKHSPLNWCVNCEELLCAGCVEHHRTLKLTRNHQLSAINTPTAPSKGQRSETCMYHPSLDLDLYCQSHDCVCCRECNMAYHNSCGRGVVPVDGVANGALTSGQFVRCNDDIKTLIESFEDLIKTKEKVETDLFEDVSAARNKIHDIKSSFSRYLDEMEVKALADLKKAEQDIVEKISTVKSYASQSLQQAGVLKNEVSTTSSDKEAFIVSHKIKSFKTANEQKIESMTIDLQASSLQAEFLDPSVIPGKFDINFGNIHAKLTQLPVQLAPLPVKLTQDTKMSVSCFEKGSSIKPQILFSCMSLTDEGYLVFAELCKVYLFNPNGQQLNSAKIQGVPYDIAAIPGGDRIVILVGETKLIYMSIDRKHPMVFAEKTVKVSKDCKCVAASDNNIFIGYKHDIVVMQSDGNFVQKWQLPSGSIQCMHAEKNGDLYYAVDNTVYCRKGLGDESCLYSSKDLNKIIGIDLDMQGNVYICGRKSNNIHMLKQGSGLAEVVLKKEDGIGKPRRIAIDKAKNTLYILPSDSISIKVFHFR